MTKRIRVGFLSTPFTIKYPTPLPAFASNLVR